MTWQADKPKDGEPADAAAASAADWQPAAGDKVGTGAWTAVEADAAFFNFTSLLGTSRTSSAYVCSYLHSPELATLALCMLHSSDTTAWLSGRARLLAIALGAI